MTPSRRSSSAKWARRTRICEAPSPPVERRALRRLLSRARRLKYLEAELAKRRGVAAVAAPSASTLREASLYETPEELRAPGAQGGAQDNADRWLTGIQEVQLPVEYQLRVRRQRRSSCFVAVCGTESALADATAVQNIEDTERAKAQLLDAQRARAGGGGGAQADGTFLQPQQAARAEGNVSTDDIVARRFMQAEKRRQRR